MSPLVIAAIIALSAGAYAFMAGVTVALAPQDLRDHEVVIVVAAIWPLALPVMGGIKLVDKVRIWRSSTRLPKAEVRRG